MRFQCNLLSMSPLSKEQKQRIIDSMAEFERKHKEPIEVTRKRKNNSPEKDLVKLIMLWLKENNFTCTVIESKAAYNPKIGRYMSSQVGTRGYCDISGNDNEGRAIYIEVKAKDRLYMLKEHQREFLISKIKSNCFAVACDSVTKLQHWYNTFISLPFNQRQDYLMSLLPKKRPSKTDQDGPLFND